jgi:hypothetical protein
MRPARRAVLMLALAVALCVTAAPASAANIDLVVMVDTSASMFPYFDDVMNYLVQDLLVQKLHRGDTFHLLSFSSVPEVEISLEVNSEAAAQRAFGRVLLLHALGRYTDLVAAVQFLYKYCEELPESNRKQIILITDGVHDPPPDSPNRLSEQAVRSVIQETASAMKRAGWTFNILKVPPEPAPGEESLKSFLPDIAETLGVTIVPYRSGDKGAMTGRTTGFPDLVFPANLGKVGSRFNASFKVKNWKDEPIIVRLTGVQSDGLDMLERPVSVTVPAAGEAGLDVPIRLPMSYPRGDHSMKVHLVFEDDLRISPTDGTLAFFFTGKGGLPIPRLTLLYVLYIVLGLAVIYLLVRLYLFLRKRLTEAPVTGLARAQMTAHGEAGVLAAAPGARGARQRGVGPLPAAKTQRASRAALAAAQAAEIAAAAGRAGRTAVAAGATPRGEKAGRKLVPLLGAPGAPARRVRPTVTSLRRALPRQQMLKSSLPPLIEMRVEQQNHRIGFRNVHRIAPNGKQSVGGGFSSYIVFLVRMPQAIAEIRNVDGNYVFTPLRAELFPDLKGPVEDCLGKDIPFVSPKGMELTLYFREWTSPLDEINRVMRQARSLSFEAGKQDGE